MMMLRESRNQEEVENNIRRHIAFALRTAPADIPSNEGLSPMVMDILRFHLNCVLPFRPRLDPPYTLDSVCYQVWRQMKARQCPR